MQRSSRAETGTAHADAPAPVAHDRLDQLEQLVHERSAELSWANEQLVAALYQRSDAEARARELRRRDRATGLPNRYAFEERLGEAVATHIAHGEPAAVVDIGIGRLAEVRETLGPTAADEAAHAIALRLKAVVRGSDTVARVGDDEFALLLTALRRGQDAATVARKLFDALDAPLTLAGRRVRLVPAVGVAVLPEDAATPDLLLARASAAMRHARDHETGLYQFFRPEIADRSARRLRLEAELAAALERDEFRVLLQPRVRMRDRRVVGAEALLRWQHPERGLLSPDAFLDVAEETGLIVPIGAKVLAQACGHAREWPARLSLAVNLAPREYRGASLVRQVAQALNDAGLDAGRLQVEVGESAIDRHDESAALDVLERLAEAGVRLVLDNFGAGVASLGALRRVPIDAVKLDGRFVRNAALDARDGAIVGALASLGRKLGLRVIAAGIESEEQFGFVRRAGVSEAQGYLLGQPMEAEAFASLFAGRSRRRAGAAPAGPAPGSSAHEPVRRTPRR